MELAALLFSLNKSVQISVQCFYYNLCIDLFKIQMTHLSATMLTEQDLCSSPFPLPYTPP